MAAIFSLIRSAFEWALFLALVGGLGEATVTMYKEAGHPCLVLCDLMMPVMNGWEFIAEVKKDKLHGFATIPIIVVSAAGDHVAAKKGPVEGYIKKPLDIEVLLKAVHRFCGPHS